jgi:hypothetical protein
MRDEALPIASGSRCGPRGLADLEDANSGSRHRWPGDLRRDAERRWSSGAARLSLVWPPGSGRRIARSDTGRHVASAHPGGAGSRSACAMLHTSRMAARPAVGLHLALSPVWLLHRIGSNTRVPTPGMWPSHACSDDLGGGLRSCLLRPFCCFARAMRQPAHEWTVPALDGGPRHRLLDEPRRQCRGWRLKTRRGQPGVIWHRPAADHAGTRVVRHPGFVRRMAQSGTATSVRAPHCSQRYRLIRRAGQSRWGRKPTHFRGPTHSHGPAGFRSSASILTGMAP